MDEIEQVIPIRNEGDEDLTVVIEPWGVSHRVAPGTRVLVVARGPAGGECEVEHAGAEIIVYGWGGSRVAVVPDTDE